MNDIIPSARRQNEDSDEGLAQLFDFLYRDSRRIESLYAQFFDGLISSLQRKSTVTQEERKGAKLNAAVATGELDSKRGTSEERSETSLPNDVVLLNLLSRMISEGWIDEDCENAKPSRIIIAERTLFLADRYLLSIAEMGLEVALREAKSKGSAGKAESKMYEMIQKMLPKMALASSFYLRTSSGRMVTGTIKEDGLDEPISAYYFKHGADGIANVRVLGFKEEVGSSGEEWREAPFFGAMRQAVGVLRSMFFPRDDIRVTPITIFRVTNRDN